MTAPTDHPTRQAPGAENAAGTTPRARTAAYARAMDTMPPSIEPEDKDWTYVITDGCAECGFVPGDPAATGAALRATLPAWREALGRSNASVRPSPQVWSAVEYGCHVRDTCELFRQRLTLMLTQDDPLFANWDQDATAIEKDYFHADQHQVLAELEREADAIAAAFDAVAEDQWSRPGRRSNGSMFTVDTFAVYFLHDVAHHVVDVTR